MSNSEEWSWPENTDSKLFISRADAGQSLGDLLTQILDHFDGTPALGEFDIEYTRWTHVESCSCCRDSGVYGDFWEITRRKEPCEYITNTPLSELCRD